MRDRLLQASTAIVPLAFALATTFLQRAGGVTMFDDELGFLGEAVFFSTRDGAPLLAGIPFYSAGYPAVLALPLSILTFDPWVVAVGVNVVLLAAIGPLLHSMARHLFDLAALPAAVVAIAGATATSVVFQVPRAWAEVCMAFAFTLWAWLLLRYSRRGPDVGALPLAVAAGAMLSVHRRSSVVVALTLGVIALWSLAPLVRAEGPLRQRARAVPWRALVTAEVAGVATALGALALDAYVVDTLYDGTTSGSRLDKAQNLFSTVWIPALLGHAWSFLATTFVLAGVGSLFLLWSLRARSGTPSSASCCSWPSAAWPEPLSCSSPTASAPTSWSTSATSPRPLPSSSWSVPARSQPGSPPSGPGSSPAPACSRCAAPRSRCPCRTPG